MIAGHFAPTAALWRRDLLRTMRKRRSGVFLALYTGLLTILIVWNWPALDVTPYMVQRFAQEALIMFVMLSYGWVAMIMPPYGAAAITQERERDTMEMLSMSLVPPWGVILGKWGAHSGLFLFVLLAAMPVMAAATFFTVGTEIPVFIALVGLIASTSITCVAIGVAFSTITKSTKSAVIFSYVGVAMMLGLPVLLFAWTVEVTVGIDSVFGFDSEKILVYLAHYFTPIGATIFIINGPFEWYDYLGVQLYLATVSLFAFAFACWRFSRLNKMSRIARRKERAATKRKKKAAPRPFTPIGDGQNAWYAREVLFGTLMRGRMRWGVFGGGCVVFGLIALSLLAQHYADPGYNHRFFVEAWVGVGLVALVVVVPGIAANTFTREFDGSRMDLLRGTLLTPRDYVLGSIRSTLRSVVPLFMSLVLATFILSPIIAGDSSSMEILSTGLGSAVVTVLLATTIGVAAGTLSKRTATALMLAYASVFAAFVGAWLAVIVTGEMIALSFVRAGTYSYNDAPNLVELREMVAVCSPIIAYFTNLDEVRRGDPVTAYWFRSIALAGAFSFLFVIAALFGFRNRMARDA